MKQKLPDSLILPGHPDFELLSQLASEITARAGGALTLEDSFPAMLRRCIDDVIMTPKTGRRAYEELEKTEKTYIGTRVEIELRALLRLPRGRLDTEILGRDVDIKNTMGSNWMIPTEALEQPCLLVAADEARARCYLGLIVARPEYLTQGKNKDGKGSISAAGFGHILWLLCDHPYPANFWRCQEPDIVAEIFSGDTGNVRMANLFRRIQNTPIARDVVEAVAQQKDFMRRIRADKGRGTRDHLEREGILLLSGQYDSQLIKALELPNCTGSEFISCRPASETAQRMAAQAGFTLPTLDC
ncbi:Type-2 restriction enzyme NaeI [Phaeobacter sp. CECT 5382]|uniref:NaeI family type II restriction endonuclease n=1 Tax=Phaeobacter sp. CECT 5382 TaxID=1712645 RepID=UPI0006DB80EE|nr:NaeI family type II restriction endonuclease [Phaeobacter sp. CECT 5382]CUH86463.1 Type-2 restriction enzyme NaeI [Phaeobacter sp. CECT 5382]